MPEKGFSDLGRSGNPNIVNIMLTMDFMFSHVFNSCFDFSVYTLTFFSESKKAQLKNNVPAAIKRE